MKSLQAYFTLVIFSILGGIFLGNFLEDFILSFIVAGVFFLIGVLWTYMFRGLFYCLLYCYIGIMVGVCLSLYAQGNIHQKMSIISPYEGVYNSYVGEVHDVYRRSDFYDEYLVELRQINNVDIDDGILHLMRIPKNFTLYSGQEIGYNGVMYPIENFNEFSYEKYMLSRGIYFSTSVSNIDTIFHRKKSIKYYLSDSRQKLLSRIENIFPKQEAIFLGGILLGARENIPKDLKEDFNNSGLTHFIAVSGFNITLCVIFATFLFGFLPFSLRVLFVSLSIIVFSFFVGLGAPVVRAAIMGILGYMFLESGNKSENITLLGFTALSMTFWNPLALSYDVSLHLSFLAVIGIIYTQKFFLNIFSFLPKTFAIREAFVLTLAALSFTLPIMIFQFGQLSVLSPLANVAVAWTIPIAMLLGAMALIADIISPFLGILFGFIAWVFLAFDIMMVRLFGNMHSFIIYFDFGSHKYYFQVLYYIFLVYLLHVYQIKKKQP